MGSIDMVGVPVRWLAGLFLLTNFITRLAVLHNYGVGTPAVLLSASLLFLLIWRKPDLLEHFCLVFGVSFPLYCYQSYTVNSQIFEFLIVVLGIVCWFRLFNVTGAKVNRDVAGFLFCYVILALVSLALFPVFSFARLFSLWGVFDFSSAVFSATPENPLYSLAAVNRLVLFFVVILLVSSQHDAQVLYRKLYLGAVLGGLIATILGILNQYSVIDLAWYRPQFIDPSGVPRLHSVMGNPGWFAQYLLGCIPFVFFLLPGRGLSAVRFVIVTAFFLLCGLALLLTGSRTSWLIFPVVAFLCYLYMLLFSTAGSLSWRAIYRGTVRIVVTFVFVGLIVTSVVLSAVKLNLVDNSATELSRVQFIIKRLHNIVTPGERAKVWRESLALGEESPVFGMGYEGYKWHQQVMNSIPESRFAKNRRTLNNWDTPHNFFIQLFISNGIVGVVIWCFLIGYTVMLIGRDLYRNKQPLDMLFLISLSAFLLYGLTQSLQYIPLIWFLLLLIFGYAMILDEKLLPHGLQQFRPYIFVICALLVLTGGGVYARNAQSQRLADEYGVAKYSSDRGTEVYTGFYAQEDWGKDGIFRWSGRHATLQFNRYGAVEITFFCNAPGLVSNPIVIDVLLNGNPVDRYTFWEQQKVQRTYWVSTDDKSSESRMDIRVSRTWNPKQAGHGGDTRNLGVAVSEPRFMGRVQEKDIGVTSWQILKQKETKLVRFRWTNRSAVINLQKYRTEGALIVMLKSKQPNLGTEPLSVRFFQQGGVIESVQLADNGWNRIVLQRQLDYDLPLTIRVNRTWNPKLNGYGSDPRDLGVAIAFLTSSDTKECMSSKESGFGGN